MKLLGLSETTKDEDICKAVRQMLLEIDAGWSKGVWAPGLYQMQGLLHYFKKLSDTQSYLSIAFNVTRHFQQASPKNAEQPMINMEGGGGG
jgi:hypothetical protein